MKKIIFLISCVCLLNTEADAVVLLIAQADDAKKAEQILSSKDKANKDFIAKSRAKLKEKHAARKAKTGKVVAANNESGENDMKAKPLSDSVSEVDPRSKEIKEVDTAQQSSQN